MKFDIYCDESNPDIFWSKSGSKARFLLIGGIWLPLKLRSKIKEEIKEAGEQSNYTHEIKWHKVHNVNEGLYKALIDIFISYSLDVRFRCIAVEEEKVDLVRFHESDGELGFYKFYYQMLKPWILDFNEYRIFCDEKTNRVGDRLKTLGLCLDNANITSRILSVQAIKSKESLLLQLADVLLGMASSRMNNSTAQNSVKDRVITYLEQKLRIPRLYPTSKSEQKFNIFKINLDGGW